MLLLLSENLEILKNPLKKVRLFGSAPLFNRDRLCQIPGLINVSSIKDCDLVGKKLERDDGEDGRKDFRHSWDKKEIV